MNTRTIKMLLWAILLMLLCICMRVLFIGYEIPNLVIWLSFALPVISISLAVFSLLNDYIKRDNEK